jgi:hypothetical protein
MRYLVWLVCALGALSGAWMVVRGENLPGVLGRGFTRGDRVRLQRAPAEYFRAMGTTILLAVVFVAPGIWLLTSMQPSRQSITILAILAAIFIPLISASAAWLVLVTARHKLFRWDRP